MDANAERGKIVNLKTGEGQAMCKKTQYGQIHTERETMHSKKAW